MLRYLYLKIFNNLRNCFLQRGDLKGSATTTVRTVVDEGAFAKSLATDTPRKRANNGSSSNGRGESGISICIFFCLRIVDVLCSFAHILTLFHFRRLWWWWRVWRRLRSWPHQKGEKVKRLSPPTVLQLKELQPISKEARSEATAQVTTILIKLLKWFQWHEAQAKITILHREKTVIDRIYLLSAASDQINLIL